MALFDLISNFKMSAMAIASCVGAVSLAALFATYQCCAIIYRHPAL
ncbi:hypothetical protein [Paenibacillus guangzhouensis]|nr:hypothetical protein [Paenibacillus guangzhouensis]